MRLFLQKLFTVNFLLALFLLFTFFSRETALGAFSPASIEYEKARVSYHSLLQSKKRMQRRDQWMSVIQKFNSVYKEYFSSNEAYKAVFTVGDLYEQLYAISQWDKDLDGALEYYQKTIKEFKPGRLTDDAFYRRGEIYFNRGKYDAALGSLQKISKILPGGDFVAKAKVRIADIGSLVYAPSTAKKIYCFSVIRFISSLANSDVTHSMRAHGPWFQLARLHYRTRAQPIAAASIADAAPGSGQLFEKRRPRASVARTVMLGADRIAARIAALARSSGAQASPPPPVSGYRSLPIVSWIRGSGPSLRERRTWN